MTTEEIADLRQEKRVRALARRRGYSVYKSRQQLHCDNLGEFMLADERNCIVMGAKYDASLEDIEAYFKEEA